ncbi:adhesion G-protein coupled receptor G2-like [Zophobas morio]|uniref:adhesion G-protein coupled receptor G2-like n=1 Tax=Zophobas morio TaxID=2755281 RepID=UPI003082AB37
MSIVLGKQLSKSDSLCVLAGLILHYSVLVQFCWMLIIPHFQYRKLVFYSNNNITNVVIKTNLFAWGVPVIIVTIVLLQHGYHYSKEKIGFCYPSGRALYFGVWWPISVVIANNVVVYIFIIDAILNTRSELRRHGPDDSVYHIRRIGSLFFFFGLTWIFGFLAVEESVIFIYLFDTLATLQGFVLFLLYVVCDKSVKEMYWNKFQRAKYTSSGMLRLVFSSDSRYRRRSPEPESSPLFMN